MSEYKFKIGDRVRYIGPTTGNISNKTLGTVDQDNSRNPWVIWDVYHFKKRDFFDQTELEPASINPRLTATPPATLDMAGNPLKVGDRIEWVTAHDCSGGSYELGTVKHIRDRKTTNNVLAIEFDEWQGGHDCDGRTDPDHGWWIPSDKVKRLDSDDPCSYALNPEDTKSNNNEEEPSKETTSMSNNILDNAAAALAVQPDDDTIILRKAGLENVNGTPTSEGQKVVLNDLYKTKRADLADRLRTAIKADEAAELGDTTSPAATRSK